MLKILETTPNRLVIKSERRNFDALIIVLFIYVAIYFLLISTLKKWTIFGLSHKVVESIYQIGAYPPLYYLSSIALIICSYFLFSMSIVDFHLPVKAIIFDCNSNLLTIKYTYLFWHYKKNYTAWEMVTVRQRLTPSEKDEAMDKEDISFTPMAIPLISGPGAIGVVTSLSVSFNHWVEYIESLVGIVLIGISLYLCLILGEPLINRLGKNGVGALNRVFGFFILAIGVRFIADGSISLLKQAFAVK